MLLLDRAYTAILLEDAPGSPVEWLSSRASLGIGLPKVLTDRCALGNFGAVSERPRWFGRRAADTGSRGRGWSLRRRTSRP
jgi:hypothetical protein